MKAKKEKPSLTPDHHKKALKELYTLKGVGRSVKQKLAYWASTCNGHSFSHNPTEEQQLAMWEQDYLLDLYPMDFHFC